MTKVLSKKSKQTGREVLEELQEQEAHKKIGWGVASSLFVGMSAFLVPQIIVAVIISAVAVARGADPEVLFQDGQYGLQLLFGILTSSIGASIVWLFVSKRGGLRALGYIKTSVSNLAIALPAYVFYFILLIAAFKFVSVLIPSIDLEQEQQIGFETAVTTIDQLYAFLALVVIAPLFEELLFRGFVFRGVASKLGWLPAAILVSGLFAFAHGQINVGIDTFILGMVASWLVWRTNSLWPAILLHSIKNLVAYIVLFHTNL